MGGAGEIFLLLVADATIFLATFDQQVQSCPHFAFGLQQFFGYPQIPSLSPCTITLDGPEHSTMLFGIASANLGQNYTDGILQLLRIDPQVTNLSQKLNSLSPDPILLRSLVVSSGPGSPKAPSASSFGTAEIIVIAVGGVVLIVVVLGCIAMRQKAKENERLRDAMTAMNAPMDERSPAGGAQQRNGQQPAANSGRKTIARKNNNSYVPPAVKDSPDTAAVDVAASSPASPSSPPPTPATTSEEQATEYREEREQQHSEQQ